MYDLTFNIKLMLLFISIYVGVEGDTCHSCAWENGGWVELVVEEMNVRQVRLFSLLDLWIFMGK